MYFKRQ